MSKKVAVIMGSDSDFPVVKSALTELKKYGVEFECRVMSAHRTPAEACQFAASARDSGFGAIICAAGMAAHLAGVVAGHTTLPVIGIPMKSKALEGVDALLATVMMPPGVPVATVGIDSAADLQCHVLRSNAGTGFTVEIDQDDAGTGHIIGASNQLLGQFASAFTH